MSISPDGQTIAAGGIAAVDLLDAATGTMLIEFFATGEGITTLDWSPDGQHLAIVERDGSTALQDMSAFVQAPPTAAAQDGPDQTVTDADSSGSEVVTLDGSASSDPVLVVTWSPDGSYLATASLDTTINIWDVATGEVLRTLQGHSGKVLSVDWSPDGAHIVSGSTDGTIRIWDMSDGQLTRTITSEFSNLAIFDVAWSPDGTRVASGDSRGLVSIYDPTTGTLLTRLLGHQDVVLTVTWNPDSDYLASGSWDSTVILWDLDTAEIVSRLSEENSDIVYTIDWQPAGNLIAAGNSDGQIRVWEPFTHQLVARLTEHTLGIRSVSWNPNGNSIASGGADGFVYVWDMATGQLLGTFQSAAPVFAISWSPDGSQLAYSGSENAVEIVPAPAYAPPVANAGSDQTVTDADSSGSEVVTLDGSASSVRAQGFPDTFVSWNPDGTMLAVANGTTVQIQDVATRQLLNAFTGLQEQDTAPVWNPDGTRLAIANGSEVQIWQQPWDASGAQLIAAFQSVPYISSMAWSPDGDRIAVVQDPLEVWDVSTAQRLYREYEHGNFILQVAWSPDGTQLATASVDKTVKIWDAATGAVLSTMRVMTDTTTMPLSQAFVAAISVAWSPDGTKLVHGADDGSVRIWDREILNGTEVALGWDDPNMLQGHAESVWAVAWSPDGSQIASGSLDGTVRIWDATTHEELRVIQVGTPVGSVAWSPDGSQLAYSGSENAVEIVPAPAYAPPVAAAGPDQTVTDADSSGSEVVTLDGSASSDPDGQIVAYSWAENGVEIATGPTPTVDLLLGAHTLTLTVTDDSGLTASDEVVITVVAAGGCVIPDPPLSGDYTVAAGDVFDLDWNPNGTRIAAGYSNSIVQIFDTGGQLLTTLDTDLGVMTVKWSPDGEKLAYAGSTYTGPQGSLLLIWDSTTGQVAELAVDDRVVDALTWSPDGTLLAANTHSNSGPVTSNKTRIWNVSTGELISTYWDGSHQGFNLDTIAWHPNGRLLAAGSGLGVVSVRDIQTGVVEQWLYVAGMPDVGVRAIAWNPDGGRLAAGTNFGTVWIWDTATWQVTSSYPGRVINDVAWSSDGRLAIADGEAVSIVHPDMPGVLTTLPYPYSVKAVAWSPDGSTLVYGGTSYAGTDTTLQITPLSSLFPLAAAGPDQTVTDADSSGSDEIVITVTP